MNRDSRQPPRAALAMLRRVLAYSWAAPTTAVGFVVAPLALFGRDGGVQVVEGVVEVYGGACAWILRWCVPLQGGASAMTLGHVILGQDRACLGHARAHEHVHVRQCERWGPLFIPAYLASSAWALVRGRHFYRDNAFEREAYGTS